jgi:hypothetical protein
MAYEDKPSPLLTRLQDFGKSSIPRGSYCAGFELEAWRCNALADHLMEWIADYALQEDELKVSHTNMYVRLREAAVRVYTSSNYEARGEIGEILLHAICRQFFNTIPIAPRVFYLSSSNEMVKSFDMVHVRYLPSSEFEIWLGEAKFYKSTQDALTAAVKSITAHIDQGFLQNEKLILGPQISKGVEHHKEIRELLSIQTSLDKLFQTAVFPVCIAGDSAAAASHKTSSLAYQKMVAKETGALEKRLIASGLNQKIRLVLIYVPLGSKDALAERFDKRLKGLTA